MPAETHHVKHVGEFVGRVGDRLMQHLEDPSNWQEMGEQAVGLVLAYYGWVNADRIKAAIYIAKTVVLKPSSLAGFSAWDLAWTFWVGKVRSETSYSGDVAADIGLYNKDMTTWKSEMDRVMAAIATQEARRAQLEAEGKDTHEMDEQLAMLRELLDSHLPKRPQPPGWMAASLEEKLLIAAFFYMIGSHPMVMAETIKGLGAILQGVGEIVPF